jgi:hypothetical protein
MEVTAGRPGAEHARLVDELKLGGDGSLREVAHDVRQADADEAVPFAGERASAGDDHHLVLRVAVRGRSGAHE